MKAAGVTTVMCMCDPLLPYFATPQANQQNYHPEWLVAGFRRHRHRHRRPVLRPVASGPTPSGWAWSASSSPATRASRTGPTRRSATDEPAQLRDIVYYPLLWLFTCLQMAGPNLTPKTFEAGCFALPPRQGELGLVQVRARRLHGGQRRPGDLLGSGGDEPLEQPEGPLHRNPRRAALLRPLAAGRAGLPAAEVRAVSPRRSPPRSVSWGCSGAGPCWLGCSPVGCRPA